MSNPKPSYGHKRRPPWKAKKPRTTTARWVSGWYGWVAYATKKKLPIFNPVQQEARRAREKAQKRQRRKPA